MGVQVDVTSKTEGTAIGDKAGVPLLVKYDARLREKGKDNVNEITDTVQARPPPCVLWRTHASSTCSARSHSVVCCAASAASSAMNATAISEPVLTVALAGAGCDLLDDLLPAACDIRMCACCNEGHGHVAERFTAAHQEND